MLKKSKRQMKTGSTVSVEELTYLATNWRSVRLKHDDKAEVVDAHHDFFIKLTKRNSEAVHSFSKGIYKKNIKLGGAGKKQYSEAA